MRNLEKYKGIIPAFYACYDKDGKISPEGVKALTKYFVEKGVKGVYVNGSSGNPIQIFPFFLPFVAFGADIKIAGLPSIGCE